MSSTLVIVQLMSAAITAMSAIVKMMTSARAIESATKSTANYSWVIVRVMLETSADSTTMRA